MIESERLFFRKLTKEDFSALCKILQDDDVMYAYEGKFNDKEVTEWLDRQLWRYENENGHGLYAVILKENGELIGQCMRKETAWLRRMLLLSITAEWICRIFFMWLRMKNKAGFLSKSV